MILGSFLILYINFGFVYLFALLWAGIFAIGGLFGRRGPHGEDPYVKSRPKWSRITPLSSSLPGVVPVMAMKSKRKPKVMRGYSG
jgi:hypothetical protein